MATKVVETATSLVVTRDGVAQALVLQKAKPGVPVEGLQAALVDAPPAQPALRTVHGHGLFGVWYLLSGPFLAVVSRVDSAAQAPGKNGAIQRVRALELLPLGAAPPTGAAAEEEAAYLGMLHAIVAKGAFFFSDVWDMTHTVQRQASLAAPGGVLVAGSPAVDVGVPVPPAVQAARAEPRFWWNAHLCAELAALGAGAFLSVCINGFVEARLAQSLGDRRVDVYLISRRANRRQGARFVVRGIDDSGNVANYVETEQLLLTKGSDALASHVQVRGSIPLLWSQGVTLRYTPKCGLRAATGARSQLLFQRHMQEQFDKYGAVTAVNLIDTKGDQAALGQAYQGAAAQLASPALTYVWFDFHKECKGMAYGKLAGLMRRIAGALEGDALFAQAGGAVASVQGGVVRTNCMDNLDRTNVVQSLMGRWAALRAVGEGPDLAAPGADVLNSPHRAFERQFKALWADHADAMSKLYSGTGALKTDFTRTGKRTLAGAAADGANSLQRYFLANFEDGRTQDAWDLFLGRFVPLAADVPVPAGVSAWADAGAAADPTRPPGPLIVRHGGAGPSPLAPYFGDTSTAQVGALAAGALTGLLALFTVLAHAWRAPEAPEGAEAGLWPYGAEGSLGLGALGALVSAGAVLFLFTKVGMPMGPALTSKPHFVQHDMVAAGAGAGKGQA